MKFKDKEKSVNLENRTFSLGKNDINGGGWLWWFWLFFIDDPAEVDKPRQLAILWSMKDDKSVTCNGEEFEFKGSEEENTAGVVAAWYFDGQEMNHNLLLEKTNLDINSSSMVTKGDVPTSFEINGESCKVKIGDEFEFNATPREYDFAINSRSSGDYPLGMSYSMLRSNRLELDSTIKGEDSEGSAYFQRVLVDAPTPSWYWGIFHFENGAILDYYKPSLLGKSLKEEIAFYDGEKKHEFEKVSVDMDESGDLPLFHVSAENNDGSKEINFTVKPYSKASWKFEKKIAKVIPNKLTYREYPAKISSLELIDKEKRITLEDLGSSVGNAEYTTGFLL